MEHKLILGSRLTLFIRNGLEFVARTTLKQINWSGPPEYQTVWCPKHYTMLPSKCWGCWSMNRLDTYTGSTEGSCLDLNNNTLGIVSNCEGPYCWSTANHLVLMVTRLNNNIHYLIFKALEPSFLKMMQVTKFHQKNHSWQLQIITQGHHPKNWE